MVSVTVVDIRARTILINRRWFMWVVRSVIMGGIIMTDTRRAHRM